MPRYNEEKISFNPLSLDDLPLLYKWLLYSHVSKWWYHGKQTFSDIEKKYIPRIKGVAPTSCFLILYDGTPIGQIQMYKINDYPLYKQVIQIDENAAGLDLFIGEKDYMHKGLGSIIISKFLKEFVFAQLVVESCIMGPHPSNIPAIKAYEKAGFKYIKTIFNSDEREEEYLMRFPKNLCDNKLNIT
jgi:RimJ/RimL family protein N-acetyltransferase